MLDKLRDLEQKATPGPWHLAAPSSGDAGEQSNIEHGSYDVAYDVNDKDAALIVELRNRLPQLIAVAVAAKALSDRCSTSDAAYLFDELDDALKELTN